MQFNPLVIIVTLTGAYLLVRLRFFFILHPVRTAKTVTGALKKRESLTSLTLALAGTLGVGNIFGVAVGILCGGAGSVFWMLVSALFASVLKYAEVLLTHDAHGRECGEKRQGMTAVIRHSLGRLGPIASVIYSSSTVLLSLFMGAALQSLTAVDAMSEIFDTPPTVAVAMLALLTLFAIIGGVKIIERVTAAVIPLTTIVYIALSVAVLAVCRERIPTALGAIVSGALSSRGAIGGVFGFLTSRAVSEGYSRGLLSNEAGAGTSSLAHARAGALNPAVSGLLGIIEVFFDTVVLCTLTALAVLVGVPDPSLYSGGMSLVFGAFTSALGNAFGAPLAACILSFAYSTVICWYFYGSESLTLLTGKRRALFLPVYVFFVLLGAVIDDGLLVLVTDVLLLVMTLLTNLALVKSSDRIVTLSESGGVLNKRIVPKFRRRIKHGLNAASDKSDS